jgi:hypothetical protein
LVAFKQLGPGESFGLEPYMNASKSGGLRYNYEAYTSSNTRVLYCSINKLVEMIRMDKELEKQLKLKFAIKEELNPIHDIISPETRLKRYWSQTRENQQPEYRINPNLILKPNTIRSPRIQTVNEKD